MPLAKPTLFARLRRYRPQPGRDAFEDRLTEALAATLEAAPEAAHVLVREWFGPHDGPALTDTVTVTTQLSASAGERIDLELVFGPAGRPTFRLWLEAKVSATPTRGQAERYLGLLPASSRLSWLLPVGVPVVGGSPEGVPEHTWQELATVLHQWGSNLPRERQSDFGPQLVQEFVQHLEEVNLAAVSPFDEFDVSAINGVEVASARINEIVRQTNHAIEAKRGPLYSKPSRASLDFWEHAPRGIDWPETAYFELHGRRDEARTEPVGDWVLGAGVSWERANAPREDVYPEWFTRRWEERFEIGSSARGMVYLFRYLALDELARVPTLTEQARYIAAGALETWSLLDHDPLREG